MPDANMPALPAAAAGPKISGMDRAAILLMTLGEEGAAQVMRFMGPKEVQHLGVAMTKLHHVTQDQVENVLNDFVTVVRNQTSLGIDSDDYLRSVLVKALGDEKAEGVLDRILAGGKTDGLESLRWMDARAVAALIGREHPQIIAIVLSYLDSDQSAQVLQLMPEDRRSDILMRVATMDGVPPKAVKELDDIIARHFHSDSNISSTSVGGVKTAAEILAQVETAMEEEIMEHIKDQDVVLSERISDLMFVFDDLINVDDRSLQTLMREISTETLVVALKGCEEALKEKFLKNMSKRAAEMLVEDMDAKGPVRVSEVEAAHKEILAVAKQKEADGEIMLGGGAGEFV